MCAYSRRYPLRYQCGICGRPARTDQRVPQCPVCMLPLCDTCNHSGFCRTHFELLAPEDQTLARMQYEKLATSKRVMLGCVFGGLAFFMMSMFLVPLSYSHSYSPSFSPFYIFLPMVIFFPLMVGGGVYYQTMIKKTWRLLNEIGRKYKNLAEVPNGVPRWPQPVPLPTSPVPLYSAPHVDLAQIRFCEHCGGPWIPGAHYCRYCGQRAE